MNQCVFIVLPFPMMGKKSIASARSGDMPFWNSSLCNKITYSWVSSWYNWLMPLSIFVYVYLMDEMNQTFFKHQIDVLPFLCLTSSHVIKDSNSDFFLVVKLFFSLDSPITCLFCRNADDCPSHCKIRININQILESVHKKRLIDATTPCSDIFMQPDQPSLLLMEQLHWL